MPSVVVVIGALRVNNLVHIITKNPPYATSYIKMSEALKSRTNELSAIM